MRRCLSSITLLLLLGGTAQAAPITYLLSGTGSGTVDGEEEFTDLSFTFSFFGDTTNVLVSQPVLHQRSRDLAGDAANHWVPRGYARRGPGIRLPTQQCCGIERCASCPDIFNLVAAAFSTYDLTTAAAAAPHSKRVSSQASQLWNHRPNRKVAKRTTLKVAPHLT